MIIGRFHPEQLPGQQGSGFCQPGSAGSIRLLRGKSRAVTSIGVVTSENFARCKNHDRLTGWALQKVRAEKPGTAQEEQTAEI
jgi:hypothetical protein